MSTLERAIAIAAQAHAGQTDKAGQPYILHPLRTMLSVTGPEERIVAVLHDLCEDCPGWTLERLRQEGFSERIVTAVDSVTKREGEDYTAFVRRAAADTLGRQVKLADLRDNCDLSRISTPTPRDFERIGKYKAAIASLEHGATEGHGAAEGIHVSEQGSAGQGPCPWTPPKAKPLESLR